jgi:hypothetical protein
LAGGVDLLNQVTYPHLIFRETRLRPVPGRIQGSAPLIDGSTLSGLPFSIRQTILLSRMWYSSMAWVEQANARGPKIEIWGSSGQKNGFHSNLAYPVLAS